MIAATLFSGIGAPECAMPEWDWRWHAEIEKFPRAALAARHPRSTNLGDVTADDFAERATAVARPEILVFGSPCQDFSVAGRRLGLDGARGNLALVALGIARRLRPRWLVFENVPGLLSSRSGSAEAERALRDRAERGTGQIGDTADAEEDSDVAAFLAAVRECGYLGCYRVLDAQFAGVPQRRRRVFFVGYLGDWRPAVAVLFEPESLRGDRPPSREARQGVAPTISARTQGGGGLGTDFDLDGGLVESPVRTFNNHGHAWWDGAEEAQAIDERGGGGARESTLIASTLEATASRSRGAGHPIGMLVPDGVSAAVTAKWAKGSGGPSGDEAQNLIAELPPAAPFPSFEEWHADTKDLGGTLEEYQRLKESEPIAFSCKDDGGDAAIDQSPTLRSMGFDASHANGGGQVAVAFQTRVGRNGRGGESDVIPALNGADAGATSDMRPCVAIFKPSHFTRDKDGKPSGVSPPLGAEPDKGDQDPVLFTGAAVRRLTPVECARLQGFADDYLDIKFRGRPAADGPKYKALGNAMNVKEVRWILQRIEQVDALQRRRRDSA